MAQTIQKIALIGAGAWGTALASVARRAGRDVVLYAHEVETADAINTDHVNAVFLPDIPLDPAIRATTDLDDAVAEADALLMVTPAQFLRATLAQIATARPPAAPIVICAKGIELDTGKLLNEVTEEVAPDANLAVLSGPTFAAEVARGLPTAVTLACATPNTATALAEVIARGLAEITRFAAALNADPRSLMGLSGLGDLTLTCTSITSRNYTLGATLGGGTSFAEAMAGRMTVAEGVTTAPAVLTRAATLQVEMPICAAVNAILHDGAGIDDTITSVLARPLRNED